MTTQDITMFAGLLFVLLPREPPRGDRITYSRLTDHTWQIWQRDLASGVDRQLTRSVFDKRFPGVGPASTVVYHTSSQRPWSTGDGGGGPERPILEELSPVRDVAVSPDGSRVVFAHPRLGAIESSNIWTARWEGDDARTVTDDPGLQFQPAWSPSGDEIAFIGGNGYGTYELYVAGVDGRTRRRLTENTSREFYPAWSPDGARIAYSSDASGDYEIWVIGKDGKNAAQLTRAPGLDSRPTWSPDGRRIAFTSRRSGGLEIWVMSTDGADQHRLFDAGAPACDPSWN